MLHTNKRLRIIGTGSYAPERIVTNLDLEKCVDTTSDWIYDYLGIRERRIVDGKEMTSDLATEAARRAIENAGINLDEIDLIIVATATPDRRAPSTACIVQHKLGVTNRCPAFDVSAVCSGFLFAMTTASQFVATGTYRTVLVIGADSFSTITDWSRRDCVFFGDGAGAAVLQSTDETEAHFSSMIFADGGGHDCFTVYPQDQHFTMDGRAVFETGTSVLPQAIRDVIAANGVALDDVAAIVPHQPSIRMLRVMADDLGIPFDRVRTNMSRYANTSAGTIPILLDEVARERTLVTGDWVVFAAVGAGWTWGAALYRW